jgi:hypothetical protein
MLRRILLAVTAVAVLTLPIAAQSPEGWSVRIDRSQSAADPDDNPNLKFVTMGKGFHVTAGPAGVFWNPKNTATGNYTAKATFTLTKPSGHTNYYGLVIGGEDLGGPKQNYIYFLVAQDGSYLINHRSGDAVHPVQARTKHEAVRTPDEKGRSTNALEVRVGAKDIQYVVNGTVVHTTPKSGMTAKTDGLVGFRVNHQLDVHVEGFEVQKA